MLVEQWNLKAAFQGEIRGVQLFSWDLSRDIFTSYGIFVDQFEIISDFVNGQYQYTWTIFFYTSKKSRKRIWCSLFLNKCPCFTNIHWFGWWKLIYASPECKSLDLCCLLHPTNNVYAGMIKTIILLLTLLW